MLSMQLSLPSLAIESLIDALNFVGRDSVALVEIFSAPLRIILMDSHTTTRIQSEIPKYTSFMHRFSAAEVAYFAVNKDHSLPVPASDNIIGLVNAFGPASADGDFDCNYNGLQLLPRRLQAKLIDPLRWQSVLRCVLMRLEPIYAFQRCCRTIPPETLSQLFAERLTGALSNSSGRAGSSTRLSSGSSTSAPASPVAATRTVSGTVRSPMARAQTLTPAKIRKGSTVNRDILLNVTDDHINRIALLCDACRQLESRELHTLEVEFKVAILKVLCDACYETSYFRHLLENNAEERANSISNMNKLAKESKNRLKEISPAKREAAIAACREINMAAAQSGKKSKKRSGPKDSNKSTKKGGKEKDEFEPSPAQLNAMLEEMLLLESLKIDKCVDDVNLEPPDELDADSYEEKSSSKSGRSKEAERARIMREYTYKVEQVELAKTMLADSIESGIEKDIKKAIRQAERSGLRWKDEDGLVYCTELLKQVCLRLFLLFLICVIVFFVDSCLGV